MCLPSWPMSGRRGHGRLGRLREGVEEGDTSATAPTTPAAPAGTMAPALGVVVCGPITEVVVHVALTAPVTPMVLAHVSPDGTETFRKLSYANTYTLTFF